MKTLYMKNTFMKHRLLSLAVLCFSLFGCEDNAPTADPELLTFNKSQADFRWGKWWESSEDVLARERGDGNTMLDEYNTREGKELVCVFQGEEEDSKDYYTFSSVGLRRADRVYSKQHADKSEYLQDYQSARESMRKAFGSPVSESLIWRSEAIEEAYANDPASWGEAVSKGDLYYEVKWYRPRDNAYLVLQQGPDETIELVEMYLGVRPFRHL